MKKNDLKIFNFLVLCIVLIGLAAGIQSVNIKFGPYPRKPKPEAPEKPPRLTYIPQFVLISFDGSRDIKLWEDLSAFKDAMLREGKKIQYTFFINAAYFLTEETRNVYLPPGHAQGQTNIGIAESVEDIRQRIYEVNRAVESGDEIAPHTTGHFSGLYWSKDEWKSEMDSFDGIIFGLDKLYPNANLPKINLKPEDIIGFRAPYLEKGNGLYEMLHENPRYRYDSSEISENNDVWPTKDIHGLWHIPLGTLYIGPNKTPVLAMDYNIYFHDSNAQNLLKKNSPAWQKARTEMYEGWMDYFNQNYTHHRAPVLVGYHFGQWNDGVYWDVMKSFAKEVCGKPEVICGTFRDLVNYLDDYGVPKM